MKRSRYSDEQIIRILRETDHDTIANVAKCNGVSEVSIYVWQKRFSGVDIDEVKRLKTLESENACLKNILAEGDLEIEVVKEITAKMVSVQGMQRPSLLPSSIFRIKSIKIAIILC